MNHVKRRVQESNFKSRASRLTRRCLFYIFGANLILSPTGLAGQGDSLTAESSAFSAISAEFLLAQNTEPFFSSGFEFVGLQLTLEGAAELEVGEAGGTVEAISSNGVRYRLVIPEGALLDPVKIELAAIGAAENLPHFDGFTAGVDLKPTGLTFLDAVKLTVSSSAGFDGELAGFGYEDGGAAFYRQPYEVTDDGLLFTLTHFSGAGVGQPGSGTPSSAGLTPEQKAKQDLAELIRKLGINVDIESPEYRAPFRQIVDDWLNNHVLPDVLNASTQQESEDAIAQAIALHHFSCVWGGQASDCVLDDPNHPLSQALAEAFRVAMFRANNKCKETSDIADFRRALKWANGGAGFYRSTPDLFDLLFPEACVTIFMDVVLQPRELRVGGEAEELSVLMGWRVGSSPVAFDQQIRVTPTPNAFAELNPPGTEDVDPVFKTYDVMVRAIGDNGTQDEMEIELLACAYGGRVCGTRKIVIDALPEERNGLRISHSNSSANVLRLDVSTLLITENQEICYSGAPEGTLNDRNWGVPLSECRNRSQGSIKLKFRPDSCPGPTGLVAAGPHTITVYSQDQVTFPGIKTETTCTLTVPASCSPPSMSCEQGPFIEYDPG